MQSVRLIQLQYNTIEIKQQQHTSKTIYSIAPPPQKSICILIFKLPNRFHKQTEVRTMVISFVTPTLQFCYHNRVGHDTAWVQDRSQILSVETGHFSFLQLSPYYLSTSLRVVRSQTSQIERNPIQVEPDIHPN